ncbi:MAG: hypothetical protein OEV08_05340, partial [Nitrospira sp.]|nr:hypothetical protein [Nitrospira sp.]
MALPCPANPSPAVIYAMILLVCTGCADAVSFTRETDTGGVVTYLFKEDRGGPMGSPHRRDALKLMEKKCPSGYIVMKDGEVRASGAFSSLEGQE